MTGDAAGPGLSVRLRHRFDARTTLDLALEAPLPGIVGLVGPSGAGKSSLLAALCGSFRPDWSEIRVGGRVLSAPGIWVPPERRRIGRVFQDNRLFPHLSVAANLRYGARRAPADAPPGPGLDEVVALLGLEGLLGRRPRMLSGGETQRVAIGRALLSRPALLAMDEPLSGLDPARRDEIMPFLLRLRAATAGPSMLYITHDRAEAAALCDTLARIENGCVAESGPAGAMLASGPWAERADAASLLDGVVREHAPGRGLSLVQMSGFALWVPLLARPAGSPVRLSVPAREPVLLRADNGPVGEASAQNVLVLRVDALRPAGNGIVVAVLRAAGPGDALLVRLTADSAARLSLRPGLAVLALVKAVSVSVLDGEHGAG